MATPQLRFRFEPCGFLVCHVCQAIPCLYTCLGMCVWCLQSYLAPGRCNWCYLRASGHFTIKSVSKITETRHRLFYELFVRNYYDVPRLIISCKTSMLDPSPPAWNKVCICINPVVLWVYPILVDTGVNEV